MSAGSSTLTILNKINNLKNFFADVNSSGNSYYFFVGRPNPWPNSDQPPQAGDTYSEFESVWEDLVFGKQLANNNLAFMAPNFAWVSNTVYNQYDQNQQIFGTNFYVVTSDSSVFKCIDNANSSPSTIQPTLKALTGTFKTSDGYTWKYLYTIPTNANTLFRSATYVPVVSNTFVANNAIPGTIDVIRVEDGGNNWQGYLTGFINSIVTSTQVQISGANTSNGFYVGSQIYLAGGIGGGQVRGITGYNGTTQTLTVNGAFSTTATIQLANNSGAFNTGYSLVQNFSNATYIFSQGVFNSGDGVLQSDSTVNGYVGFINSIAAGFYGLGPGQNFSAGASPTYPIIDIGSAPVAQTGLVTVIAGSNQITATTANLLNLAVNNFVQVGANNFNNVRRITSITNSSVANVSVPFNANLTANVFSIIPRALEPISSVLTATQGPITFVNLNGLEGLYGNISSVNKNFIVGEFVELFNSSNASLAANGIIAYVNSSSIILSNTNGTFTGNNFLFGTSSNTFAQLFTITTFPSVVVSGSLDTWQAGIPAWVYNANAITGNATIVGLSFTPSPQTSFVISPLISINGDGSNTLAYAIVNNAPNAPNNISSIVVIDTGSNYTTGTVIASANSLYGSGANLYPVISPANGHGADAISELGAAFGGISLTVNSFASENFFFPPYGSYRRSGILKNPLYQNINLTVGTPQRQNLSLTNPSGSFSNSEIVLGNVTAGIVVGSNSTFMQVRGISGGPFVNTAVFIKGLNSATTANITSNGLINFNLVTNSVPLFQGNNQVALLIDVISNSNLLVTNVAGKLGSNLTVFDSSINAYATVSNVLSSNGQVDVTANFGNNFNQTTRVSLSQNSITQFSLFEEVVQSTTEAQGMVISTNGEVDLLISNVSGAFSGGATVTDAATSANGVILWANTTYIKVSGVSGSFGAGDRISTVSANANINSVFTVLTLANVTPSAFQTNAGFTITGANSGAVGISGTANAITYPQLVKGTGDVLYVTDQIPFTINTTSKEAFLLVLSF